MHSARINKNRKNTTPMAALRCQTISSSSLYLKYLNYAHWCSKCKVFTPWINLWTSTGSLLPSLTDQEVNIFYHNEIFKTYWFLRFSELIRFFVILIVEVVVSLSSSWSTSIFNLSRFMDWKRTVDFPRTGTPSVSHSTVKIIVYRCNYYKTIKICLFSMHKLMLLFNIKINELL